MAEVSSPLDLLFNDARTSFGYTLTQFILVASMREIGTQVMINAFRFFSSLLCSFCLRFVSFETPSML